MIQTLENEDNCVKRDTGIIDSGLIDGEDKMENKEQGNRNDNWQILSYTMEN